MSYQILAQKYRPQKFEDVVGQEAVTRTLKNSVIQGRVANAYIFCGPRGVGKTSVARLLSKTLNCEKTPEESPCNKCLSCKEITQGSSIDVLEIDGASNRGIDEIRTLRENVKFSPAKGKYKIYIIDEVHMLTQEAFNALLKTLEEPPAHVKFMFATTEPHKVIPTIMSRCQRFDFRKIPPKLILERVRNIAKKEKINIEDKAAIIIARSADGSLRDSLVILDQMVSFSGNKITAEDVIELLGMVHKDKMFELSEAIIENDSKIVAGILDGLINSGKDPVFITNSLIEHFRDLMILKTMGKMSSDMAISEDEYETIKAQLDKLSLEETLYILQNLSYCLTLMKGTMFARAALEITLIRLTKRSRVLSLSDIMANLKEVEMSDPIIPSLNDRKEISLSQNPPNIAGKEKTSIAETENIDHAASDFGSAGVNWKALLNYVKNKKMSAFTYLNAGKPVEFNGEKVVIGFGKDHAFNKEALETGDNKSFIEKAITDVTGKSPLLEFKLLDFLSETADKDTESVQERNKIKEDLKPTIEKAMDIFGGSVVRDFMEGMQ